MTTLFPKPYGLPAFPHWSCFGRSRLCSCSSVTGICVCG